MTKLLLSLAQLHGVAICKDTIREAARKLGVTVVELNLFLLNFQWCGEKLNYGALKNIPIYEGNDLFPNYNDFIEIKKSNVEETTTTSFPPSTAATSSAAASSASVGLPSGKLHTRASLLRKTVLADFLSASTVSEDPPSGKKLQVKSKKRQKGLLDQSESGNNRELASQEGLPDFYNNVSFFFNLPHASDLGASDLGASDLEASDLGASDLGADDFFNNTLTYDDLLSTIDNSEAHASDHTESPVPSDENFTFP